MNWFDKSCYVPGAFMLHFVPGVLDENGKAIPARRSEFMHEYAHFVQDLSTVYGALGFMDKWGYFTHVKALAHRASAPLQLPLSSQSSSVSPILLKLDLSRCISEAPGSWRRGAFWAFEDWQPYSLEEANTPFVMAKFRDNSTAEQYEQVIGAREVKEAYSIAVQQMHQDELIDESSLPFEYAAAGRILGSLGKLTPRHMVVFCHWALQCRFPGCRLFELMQITEQEFGYLPVPEVLCDFFRDSGQQKALASLEKHRATFSSLVADLGRHGDDDPLFRVSQWYLSTAFPTIRQVLAEGKRFPLDTYLCTEQPDEDDEAIEGWHKLVERFPIGLMESDEARVFSTTRDKWQQRAAQFFRCLMHLGLTAWSARVPKWSCPMLNSCSYSRREEAICRETPWKMGDTKTSVCVYGAAARHVEVHRIGFQGQP